MNVVWRNIPRNIRVAASDLVGLSRLQNLLLAVVFPLVAVPCAVASVIVPPPDLGTGDEYRLIFVTADPWTTGTPAEFVNAEAQADPALPSVAWYPIYSDASYDARDVVPARPTVPIYNLAGERVADESAALWLTDTVPLLHAIRFDSHGVESLADWVITRTTSTGTYSPTPANPTSGRPWATNFGWVAAGLIQVGPGYLYGISDTIRIASVPEPSIPALLIVAIVVAYLTTRRSPSPAPPTLRR